MPETFEFSVFDTIYLLIMLAGGFYCIVSYVRMKHDNFTSTNQIVIPSGCEAKKCKDMPAFKKFMGKRVIILAVVLLGCGVLQAAVAIMVGMEIIPGWTEQLLIIPVIVVIIWYIWSQKQAQSRFW